MFKFFYKRGQLECWSFTFNFYEGGAAGERYGLAYLAKMMGSLGNKLLFKHKSYGQTYADGAEV